MTLTQAKAVLKRYNQEHLLQYFDELDDSQKEILLSGIERADFTVLNNLTPHENKTGVLTPADALSVNDVEARFEEFKSAGLKAIRAGKVAAVLLAGGQGTRLGSDLPKGMYDIGETRSLTIFRQQMNNIFEITEEAGCEFDIFVMTSEKNDEITRKYFEENSYFGYDKNKFHFFVQETAPTCSWDGKVFLEEKYKISASPNGNGGWYSSIIKAGLGEVIEKKGIEWLNVYSVDNVLQRICDPVFVGATLLSGCACSGKVVKKVSPEEKVGVLCKEDGLPAIVEYYEMSPKDAQARDEDGELKFRYGVTLNYLFNVEKLNGIYKNKLPYHMAKKKIPYVKDGEKINPEEINGYKFETLVVDMIKMMGSCLAVEVKREREFAPVKNKEGADSVESARRLLKLNGVKL